MDNTGRQISAGNAAKIAADIAIESVKAGLDPDTVVQVWAGIVPAVTSHLIGVSESVELTQPAPSFEPQQALQASFPGAQVVTSPYQPATAPQAAPAGPAAYVAPPSNVVPFPVQQPQGPAPFPAQGPAPVPGVGNGEDPETAQAWAMFFNDIATGQYANNWKDNRSTKRGAKSADFIHNTLKQQSNPKYALSLWIDGKKNPSYVAGELARLGIAQ
jgi:hypothetical protein